MCIRDSASCASARLTCAGGDCDVPGGYQVLYDAPTAYDKVLRNDEFDWQMANPNKARSGVWMRHTLAGLESGSKYHVRVAGVNAAGTGAFSTVATTAAAVPDRLTSGAVQLQTLARGAGVSVADAATSLSVSWAPPLDDNGYEVTGYEVEWWRGEGVDEVEIVEINAVAHNVSGTFKLTYDGATTVEIDLEASALDVEKALEALPTLRDVHVELTHKDGYNPTGGEIGDPGDYRGANYSWAVTFLTEWPAATNQRLSVDTSGLAAINSTIRALVGYGLTADLPGHTATIPQVNVSSGSAVIRASASHDYGPNGQTGSAPIRNVEGACDPGEWILLGPAGQQRPYQVCLLYTSPSPRDRG